MKKKIMIMIFPFSDLTLSEKFWKSKMTKSCINGEKRVTYIGSKIMYIGHWSLFMTPPKNRKYLCHPVLSHPRNFYATPQFWNVYATHFYTTLNISVFQRKIRNWGSISTFWTHFFHSPPFFFVAPFRKLKSWCHPYFMPPWKSLCHPRGWDKKYGSGIKKNQWHRVTCGKIWRCGCRFSS